MTRSFLVPIDMDVVTPEELSLTASEIQDAVERAGIPLAGDVHPWENPTLLQPAALPSPPPMQPPTL